MTDQNCGRTKRVPDGTKISVTDSSGQEPSPVQAEAGAFYWRVMQSLKHRKWILAVMRGDFSEYRVTDLMSDDAALMVQYADYMNTGKRGSRLDEKSCRMLEQIKKKYTDGRL